MIEPREDCDETVDRAFAAGDGSVPSSLPACPRGDDDESALLAWLRPIRERLAASFNLEEEVAFLAWELGRLPDGLNREERAALILLALTTLIAHASEEHAAPRFAIEASGSKSPAYSSRTKGRGGGGKSPA